MSDPRFRILAIGSHPVQYMAPLLRRMAKHPQFDLMVAYCTLRGAEPAHDPEFNTTVQWDIPLLDGYPWQEIPNRGSGSESFWGLTNPGLWNLIRQGHFDAVLCYLSYRCTSFWISFFASRLSGTAFLFGADANSLVPRNGRRWKLTLKKFLWPRLFRLADQVFVPSRASVEMMRGLGIPEDNISLTPFVVENDWWAEQARLARRDETRAKWGVSNRDLVVLFCAKLQPWKRPMDLLRAFAKAAVPDSVLVFAGEGPQRNEIEREAVALGVASKTRMLGFVNQNQLPSIYSSADLFVLPSSYDPCPVVVCEAMLCGLPVVLSDEIRGRFDLVQSGVTGDIYPCGDITALAESLRRLLANRSTLAGLGEAARLRMASWSPEDNIAAAVAAVSSAVRHRRG